MFKHVAQLVLGAIWESATIVGMLVVTFVALAAGTGLLFLCVLSLVKVAELYSIVHAGILFLLYLWIIITGLLIYDELRNA